ncbi:hypothetical protein BaRGS_00028228 [Batillaria attramentaria]|uniref:Uncharacterized protein n=1 Tax=Batillaria attramentaria TaxID=370345 RepID=A0ABD0K0G7_9CAEN
MLVKLKEFRHVHHSIILPHQKPFDNKPASWLKRKQRFDIIRAGSGVSSKLVKNSCQTRKLPDAHSVETSRQNLWHACSCPLPLRTTPSAAAATHTLSKFIHKSDVLKAEII